VSVALVTQNAKRVRHILSSVECPVIAYFSTLSHKGHDFRKNVSKHEVCVLIFSTSCMCGTYLTRRRIERDIVYVQYVGLNLKYQLFLSDFKET
jgi:DNA-binding winged helix-turn-helix (wHTH) protein